MWGAPLFFSENKMFFYVSISGKTAFFFVLFPIFKVKRKFFYWILYSKINISILKSLRWTFNSYIRPLPSISVFSRVFQEHSTTVLNNIRFVRWYMKWRLVAANSLAKRRKSGMASVVLPQSNVPLPGPEGHGAVQGRSATETAKSPVVVVNTISVSRKSWLNPSLWIG